MFDLGRTILASAERNAQALAIVDGQVRLTYGEWAGLIGRLADGLRALGLEPGDHVVTVLQNRWQMATIHWACQVAGLIATPLNWRFSAEELDYCLADSGAKAVVFEDSSSSAVAGSETARSTFRVALDDHPDADASFQALVAGDATMAPQASAEDFSLMLYTSGTTGRPKGVPRRHRAERAAAVAHVAQNRYGGGERTLEVV